ncbi:MAG: AEC family transporter [Eggerthellaceae bacterium]|jgi:predicted permease
MLAIFSQLAILFVIIAVGYALKRLGIMTKDFDERLSKVVLDATLPAMILGSVLAADTLPSPAQIGTSFLLSLESYAVLIAFALAATAVLRVKPGQRGVYRFMIIFSNVGFIGFPVLSAVYGSEAIIYGSIMNLPFNVLVFTVGAYLLAQDNECGVKVRVNAQMFRSPTLVACIASIALAAANIHSVPFVGDALNALGAMTTPAALLIIGSSLANLPLRDLVGTPRLWVCSLLRVVAAPLVVWAVFHPFVSDPELLGILVIIAAMPVATNGTLLCYQYGGDSRTMAQGTFITTVLSLATIPALVAFVA